MILWQRFSHAQNIVNNAQNMVMLRMKSIEFGKMDPLVGSTMHCCKHSAMPSLVSLLLGIFRNQLIHHPIHGNIYGIVLELPQSTLTCYLLNV